MTTPSVEDRLAKLEESRVKVLRRLKVMDQAILDLWDRVNGDGEAHSIEEDEIRDIAERARRAVKRIEKELEE